MARKNLIMHYSLFVAMVGIVAAGDAYSAVRIGNATKNQYYASQMAERQKAIEMASVNEIQKTSGKDTEQQKTSADDAQLAVCSTIYPNGEFEIARPTAGVGNGGAKTCTAVVELRGIGMGQNGSDAVLARANVAAGTTLNCNVSEFPEYSYTLDAQNVTFPADAEPTVDDVKRVMNQEQKQNAGLKIAAAALVGAIGGNISGKNDPGKDGFMGTDKGKLKNTAIGAVGGAAIGAGGAYGGYTGGNMIMSAGINAAAGAVAANIMAAGDSVLRIEKCTVADREDSCLYGYVIEGTKLESRNDDVLCKGSECYKYYINLNDGSTVMRCEVDGTKCMTANNLISIRVKDGGADKALESLERKDLDALKNADAFYIEEDIDGNKTMKPGEGRGQYYAIITSANIDGGKRQPAMIAGFTDSAFGRKRDYWIKWKGTKGNENTPIYHRNSNGGAGERFAGVNMNNFYPMYIDSDSGGIVDLGNKARLKSTVIGAGAGGALGAFTAYEGAQGDIDDRWVSAVREYKDSLQKFYCVTGDRFLSYYNDVVFIPSVKE